MKVIYDLWNLSYVKDIRAEIHEIYNLTFLSFIFEQYSFFWRYLLLGFFGLIKFRQTPEQVQIEVNIFQNFDSILAEHCLFLIPMKKI